MVSVTLPRLRRKNPVAAVPKVLAGYRPLTDEKVDARRRRRLLALLFFVTFLYSFIYLLMPRALNVLLSFPIVILYLMVIWALPVSDYYPRKWLNFCFWSYFIALLLWPNYLAIGITGLPWITVVRLFGAPMVILMMVYSSSSAQFRKKMSDILSQSRTIVRLVVAFAAIQLISVAFAASPFDAIYKAINNQIAWTAIFFCSVWVFSRPRGVEFWLRLYIIMATILCGIAIAEARHGGVLWANSIPSFLKIDDESVERILGGAYRLGSKYRVVATATTPLSLAELLGATSPLLLFALTQYRNLFVKIGLIALDVSLVYCILLTDSRLGLIAMIVGHVAYAAYYSVRQHKFGKNSLLSTSLLMLYPAAVALLIAAVLLVGRINNVVIGDGRQSFSDQARAAQISDGLVEIWFSPIFGFGPGQGAARLNYTNAAGTLTIDSYYLSVLLDYGFVGFFVFYGLFIATIVKGFKTALLGTEKVHHLSAAISIFLVCFLTTKAVLSQEANHSLIFMGLGAVVALSYAARRESAGDGQLSNKITT